MAIQLSRGCNRDAQTALAMFAAYSGATSMFRRNLNPAETESAYPTAGLKHRRRVPAISFSASTIPRTASATLASVPRN